MLARYYGFKSWRALKSHVGGFDLKLEDRKRIFEAARAGDIETVQRAFASGFGRYA